MPAPKLETLTASVKATALISELLLGTHVVAAIPHDIVPTEAALPFSGPAEFDPATLINLNVSEPQWFALREQEKEWTKAMEKRFEALSIGEAFSKLSGQEKKELEEMTKERRRLHHPRSAEEILFEYRQRKLTSNLVKAVQEYVTFHDVPHKARAAAR
jgi:hypothetical protein